MKNIIASKFNALERRTGKISRKILAVLLVFAFCITLLPYTVDSVYAESRGRYVFPQDTASVTAGTSFLDPSGLLMTIYKPDGSYNNARFADDGQNIILSPKGSAWDSAGFATSVNRYNIAQNDFEITYVYTHAINEDTGAGDNDGGMAFAFHNDPYNVLKSSSGSGALGIYGAYTSAGSPSPNYSLLDNAIAVELDAFSFKSYSDSGTSRLWFDSEPLVPVGGFSWDKWRAHLAITRPGYADADKRKIEHYRRADVQVSLDPKQKIAKYSTVKVTWELIGAKEYRLTAEYYHNAITATGAPDLRVFKKFTYDEAFGSAGNGGLLGGEEVYLGFSAGREFSNGPDMSVRLVDRTSYDVYHVVGSGPPWPAATDPRMLASEKRYALLNSKINLTDRKKTFSEYIFDKAYFADGTVINDISSVDFATVNQKYYMSYVKKIIEDPTTQNPPDGYRRIIFHPTADGKITNSGEAGKPKVFDIHGNLTWDEAWTAIQAKIPAVYKNNSKTFKNWNPALPADDSALISSIPPDNAGGNTTTFTAVYRDTVIESPSATQMDDEDYVIIRFDANDLNNGTADEVIRGRLNSKKQGSAVTDEETITYAVLKGTKWCDFADIAAAPTLVEKDPYWLFDNGSGNNYVQNSWMDYPIPVGTTMPIPAYNSEEPVEVIFWGAPERYKTYYAQYTENTPMGAMIKTGELAFWAVSLGLLLFGIIIISRLLKKTGKNEEF